MCPFLLWLPPSEKLSEGSLAIAAQIAPGAPFVVDLIPMLKVPPGGLTVVDLQTAMILLCQMSLILGYLLILDTPQCGRLPHLTAPPLFFHNPPQLLPHPLPKTEKLLHKKKGVTLSLPIPGTRSFYG